MQFIFEWDEVKAKENFKKHKVSFEEAKTIFNDPYSITIPDPQHSLGEYRYIDIGFSSNKRTLVVVYTERGSSIRIISSRKANKQERRIYEEGFF
ncbi:MAG: BrnT family toxin [bacterium]|nr:MAG: BrnT family toxin [bacterium]